jgi:cell wall-associated NlpC family hydrolase
MSLDRSRPTDIVAEALTWLGTPWHHRAAIKGAGVDCGGLLIAVLTSTSAIGPVDVPEYPSDFALHRDREWFAELVAEYADPIAGPPAPADIVLYRYGRSFSHGAFVVDWPTIIHAARGRGVVLDDAERNAELQSRVSSVWRLRG